MFLATEILFFGGLFAVYTIYRVVYPQAYAAGSDQLNVWLGTSNTAILLCSSLFVALAVHAIQHGHRRTMIYYLLGTMLLGITFLGIKGFEYYGEYQEHLIPGLNFAWEGEAPQAIQLFFIVYFAMTGLHAIHMIIGLGVIGVIVFWASRGHFSALANTSVELAGLYWHFVDIVWVFLYPLLYLIDRHH